MDKDKVKIGMRVVPHTKTGGLYDWKEFKGSATYEIFKKQGYLTVDAIDEVNGEIIVDSWYFYASDFEPYIEQPQTLYQRGDWVRVRDDLEGGERYGGVYFNPEMKKYCGKVIQIKNTEESLISKGYYCELEGFDVRWFWTDAMFYGKVPAPVAEPEYVPTPATAKPEPGFQPKDKIRVRDDAKDPWGIDRFRGQVVTVEEINQINRTLKFEGNVWFHLFDKFYPAIVEHAPEPKRPQMARFTLDMEMPGDCNHCLISTVACRKKRDIKGGLGSDGNDAPWPKDRRLPDCPLKLIEG